MHKPQDSAAAPAGADPSIKHFRTADFPQRHRFEAWDQIIGRAIMKLQIEPLADRQSFGDITMRMLPDLTMSSGRITGMQFGRPPALIDNDDLFFHVSEAGSIRAHQRDFQLDKGEAVLISCGQTGLISAVDISFLTFRIPKRVMSSSIADLDRVLYRPIRTQSEALRLLVTYADGIRRMPNLGDPDTRHLAAAHMRDLIALALGATRDAAEVAKGRGLRAARLRAIKADIADGFARPGLSIDEIAVRQRVTPRYVQMLFETEGTTFTEFVLDARLLHAHRMLTDPRLADRPIISVALDSGFQDLSYFNRTFRRRFGDTPSGVRASGRTANGT